MNEIKTIFTEGGLKTPHIDFNHLTGELILSGRSIPENAAKVYEPLLKWISIYVKSPRQVTNFRLNLEYFNSSTTIWLAKLIKALAKIEVADCILNIHIYFEAEDFDELDTDEIRNIIVALIDNIGEFKISIGIKIYGTDSNGKIIKESAILI
jgi:hypothetical protein